MSLDINVDKSLFNKGNVNTSKQLDLRIKTWIIEMFVKQKYRYYILPTNFIFEPLK